MSAVFLDTISVDRGDLNLEKLRSTDNAWIFHENTSIHETADRIHDAEIVVSNKVVIDKHHLAQVKNLKLICVAATGTNNIDLIEAKARGIAICNVRAYATHSVVQHVFSLILALSRQLFAYKNLVHEGAWQKSPFFCLLDYPIEDLYGKNLGVIGYGELGKAVAGVAKAFGMNILIAQGSASTGTAGRVPLETVLRNSDIISLHCPLTEQTRGLIGRKELSVMKKGALLINTARGGIVDEKALIEALESRQLGGAGFDVLSQEPPVENPLLTYRASNLIVTPHIAWASVLARQTLIDEIAENILAYKRGELRNLV